MMNYQPTTENIGSNMGNNNMIGMKQMRNSKNPFIIFGVVVVLLLVLGFLFRDRLGVILNRNNAELSDYQAVFLTNGQVYFGKISQTRDTYVVLKDIYYLQVNKQLQPADTQTASQSQLSLIKLGNELHGPDDLMHINRDQILFFEDLKSDGRVAQAITEYQKNKGNVPVAGTSASDTSLQTGTTDSEPATQPVPKKKK